MDSDSPFDVLGIDPDADETEVQRAYRERVKEAHPDQGGSAREFRAVQTAYERIRAGGVPDSPDELDDPGEPETGGGGGTDDDGEGEVDGDDCSRVEYLNYDVLGDYGWEIDDEDLFEKAAAAGLDPVDYGELLVRPGESLLEAAESCGLVWPFACRGGACTNCAVAVIEGEMPPPTSHILPPEMIERGIRLSCITAPTTEDMRVVYNVKHLPGVNELLLPASRFEQASSTD